MTMTGAIMFDRFAARSTAAGATVFAPLSLLSLDLTLGCRVRWGAPGGRKASRRKCSSHQSQI